MKSIPSFVEKKDLFDFLIENKSALVAEKKYSVKQADTTTYLPTVHETKADKTITDPQSYSGYKLGVKLVINTTNIMDSHHDVHIPGLWNKSLKENKNIYLLQEHRMAFDSIIADGVKASAEMMDWKSLGLNVEGQTQALIFNCEILKDRNSFMFDQYQRGFVKNHSVGMHYVNLFLCINDKDYAEEYANWKKYNSEVINIKEAKELGYFWAVTEAKIVEGSAVVMGSNQITPSLIIQDKNEPLEDTQKNIEPLFINTQKANEIINNFKFIK